MDRDGATHDSPPRGRQHAASRRLLTAEVVAVGTELTIGDGRAAGASRARRARRARRSTENGALDE